MWGRRRPQNKTPKNKKTKTPNAFSCRVQSLKKERRKKKERKKNKRKKNKRKERQAKPKKTHDALVAEDARDARDAVLDRRLLVVALELAADATPRLFLVVGAFGADCIDVALGEHDARLVERAVEIGLPL